ncbi:hypothetical protein [Lactococcus lactis]
MRPNFDGANDSIYFEKSAIIAFTITFDDRRLLIGYNNEDIRTFIPWRLR